MLLLVLMIIVVLAVYGICLGSFVNALVWRIYAQSKESNKRAPNAKQLKRLSISKGRSMCPDCKHALAAKDLLPVLSWVALRGKCRYCKRPISVQYPAVELLTAALFVVSFHFWPRPMHGLEIVDFVSWLLLIVGFMALIVYDLRWMLLPNRIVYPLGVIAGIEAAARVLGSTHPVAALLSVVAAVAIGGGVFYLLFQLSAGKWIGGGDVKLGWLLGLSIATPANSALLIFIAALAGCLVTLPLLAVRKLKRETVIPFGPFLIVGAIIAQLFGSTILNWYQHALLGL